MRIFIYFSLLILLAGCKKKDLGPRVDIYLLKSFTTSLNTSTVPNTVVISDALLESAPLVADQDILAYTESTRTFTILKNIIPIIKDFGQDKGFAVTVDDQPIYYGRFHPSSLSSMTVGVATIDPLGASESELPIRFFLIGGNATLESLDKRNDIRILNTLRQTNRLK